MTNPHNIKVGQKLWFVPWREHRKRGDVEIVRVGRKYGALNTAGSASIGHNDRLNLESLRVEVDGYGTVGQCYLDREEYERREAAYKAWSALKAAIGYRCPEGVTVEDIAQARRLLRLEEENNG
jgi:hypothetical protein